MSITLKWMFLHSHKWHYIELAFLTNLIKFANYNLLSLVTFIPQQCVCVCVCVEQLRQSIQEANQAVASERKKNVDLLNLIFPAPVAKQLWLGQTVEAQVRVKTML